MDQTHLESDSLEETSAPFLGRWRRLVSTTNWEKGRIIHEWRAALLAADAPAAEYSDDAWSRRAGGVSPQHAGRLRRVFDRFGEVHEGYTGLYWSHFQAAIDWNDAEMWLEGALQNRWSVADMRRERWQAFGGEKAEHSDDIAATAEFDEDSDPVGSAPPTAEAPSDAGYRESVRAAVEGRTPSALGERAGSSTTTTADRRRKRQPASSASEENGHGDTQTAPFRPFADLPSLPDDLSEAFESFKLAILRHKTAGWQEVSCADLLRSLDALKALATAPA